MNDSYVLLLDIHCAHVFQEHMTRTGGEIKRMSGHCALQKVKVGWLQMTRLQLQFRGNVCIIPPVRKILMKAEGKGKKKIGGNKKKKKKKRSYKKVIEVCARERKQVSSNPSLHSIKQTNYVPTSQVWTKQ